MYLANSINITQPITDNHAHVNIRHYPGFLIGHSLNIRDLMSFTLCVVRS